MVTCSTLLAEFRQHNQVGDATKLKFQGVTGEDVYNISAPIDYKHERYILGRVEARDSEDSHVRFFKQDGDVWTADSSMPTLHLQDPFFTVIGGEYVIGGVEIFPHPEGEGLSWRTVFYKGQELENLTRFFEGPDGMKDLRLIELQTGKVGIFTRPQGQKGGRGKIGYAEIDSLADITVSVIDEAPLLEDMFTEEEWGGGNEIHRNEDGTLLVLGHIACFDDAGDRHYYPMLFDFDPRTATWSNMRIVAERSSFPAGESKRPDLEDVVFAGGLIVEDESYTLYAGLSDCEAGTLKLAR